ncbi:MAG: hypothetical protein ACYTF7_11860, partial [Planctomycetota bacterium]
MQSRRADARSLVGAIAALGFCASTQAQVFENVADTDDFFPFSGGMITTFDSPPSVDGERIYFIGATGSFQGVLVGTSGSLTSLADEVTSAPNAVGSYEGFSHVSAGGDRAAFNAVADGDAGIYGRATNGPFFVASTGSTTLGLPIIFQQFGNVFMDEGNAVFWAETINTPFGPEAIFLTPEQADTADIAVKSADFMPGSGGDSFINFGHSPVNQGFQAIFNAQGNFTEGIYQTGAFANERLVDNNEFDDGGTTYRYTGFRDQLASSATETAFIADLTEVGARASLLTISTVNRTTFDTSVVASTLDSPGASFGTFTDFLDSSVSLEGMIFTATGSEQVRGDDQQGLFLHVDGSLITLVDRLSTIEGKLVDQVIIGNDS